MQVLYGTVAKMPTGEIAYVLKLIPKTRQVLLGTKRPSKWGKERFQTATMYVDALQFAHGKACNSDGIPGEPLWWSAEFAVIGEWCDYDEYYEVVIYAHDDDNDDVDESPFDSLNNLNDKTSAKSYDTGILDGSDTGIKRLVYEHP